MLNQNLFTDLKLRASYGVTGNAAGFSPYTPQFISGSLGTYYYDGTTTAAATLVCCGGSAISVGP